MAKQFSTKDAKEIIEEHRMLSAQLKTLSGMKDNIVSEITKTVAQLNKCSYFEAKASYELRDGLNETEGESFYELVSLLYKCRKYTPLSETASRVEQTYRPEIEQLIEKLQPGTGAIRWFFSSGDKKDEAQKAYSRLTVLKNGEYADAIRRAKQLTENVSVDADTIKSDFDSQKRDYYYTLVKYISRAAERTTAIPELSELRDGLAALKKDAENVAKTKEAWNEKIKAATDRLVGKGVVETLRGVPLEELNHDGNGFRLKPLYDSGYSNMADIFAASVPQIAFVRGVSDTSAWEMKRIATDYARKVAGTVRIRLNVDDKTKESTQLVRTIFSRRKCENYLSEISELQLTHTGGIEYAMMDLKLLTSGIKWAFAEASERTRYIKAYRFLKEELEGDYGQGIRRCVRGCEDTELAEEKEAWEDFSDNTIAYYNILEKLIPGILGNDDGFYGMPEDLAREIQEECFFPDGLNCQLRPYQEFGVKYILHQERVLLGDEMGLGKTVQAIASMVSLRNTGATHFIVVCPASVLPNWCKEVAVKSKLRVTKIHGAGRGMALKSWLQTGGVAVTTFETTGCCKLPDDYRFDMMIVDEAHYIKNPEARRTVYLKKLGQHAKRMLFMTGTALENKVEEMIQLIDILQPRIAKEIRALAFMSSAPQFREKIAPVYYRRKREDVLTELPELILNDTWSVLSKAEEEVYEADALSKNFAAMRRVSWSVNDARQSAKANRMLELIEEATMDNRKIIVFSFFLDTIRKAQLLLGSHALPPINGSVPVQKRQAIIDEFEKAPAGTVLLAQIQSGGTGLNIQSASVVILCEPQLKPSIENQAISRAYRMGQSRNVLVYRLLCENTIDDRMMDILAQKQAQFDAFADKSVAAELEIDTVTQGEIIREEIERIKKKNGEGV